MPRKATQVPIERRLLPIKEAAVYLGLSSETLYKWVARREIRHVRIGRSIRFDIKELDQMIDENRVDTYRYERLRIINEGG